MHFPTRALRWLVLLALLGTQPVCAQYPVIKRIHDTADVKQDSVFQLGSTITLEVTGLNRWLQTQEQLLMQRGFNASKAHEMTRDLVLYIDDAPLIGMPPLAVYANEAASLLKHPAAATALTSPASVSLAAPVAIDSLGQPLPLAAANNTNPPAQPDSVLALLADHPTGVADKVIFRLRRDVNNYRYWNVVYNSPWEFVHPSKIGLGYADRVFTELYPSNTGTIRLVLIQPLSLWFAGICTLLLAVGVLVLATRSWLLRETDGTDDGDPNTPPPSLDEANPPYSLAKIQLAWWTFIILSSYFIIYCATGIMADLSTTSLALLGISAGTTALSGLISPPTTPAGQPTTAPQASRGWVRDILSDEHGISIHRLQKVVIALIMGFFFVHSVYLTVTMPVWTTNQTLLLAVSSATYLGLKWQQSRLDSASAAVSQVPPVAVGSAPLVTPTPTVADPYASGLNGYNPLATQASYGYSPPTSPAGYPGMAAMNGYGVAVTQAGYPLNGYAQNGSAGPGSAAYYASSGFAVGSGGPVAGSTAPVAALAGGPAIPDGPLPPTGLNSPAPGPASALATVPTGLGSLADPVTGAVIRREEDDMGPESAAEDFVPATAETEQLPG